MGVAVRGVAVRGVAVREGSCAVKLSGEGQARIECGLWASSPTSV